MQTIPYTTPEGLIHLVRKDEHDAVVRELNERLTQQQADMLDTIVQLRAELTSWQSMAAQYSADREHNANMAGMWQAMAERLATAHKEIANEAIWPDTMRMRSIKALADYESAAKGEQP